MDYAFGMQARQIELMAKPVPLLLDVQRLIVEYHGDQIEFGVRPHISRFIDEYPEVEQGSTPRCKNGGKYPRRRVNQGLFDQSVDEHYKAYEPLRQLINRYQIGASTESRFGIVGLLQCTIKWREVGAVNLLAQIGSWGRTRSGQPRQDRSPPLRAARSGCPRFFLTSSLSSTRVGSSSNVMMESDTASPPSMIELDTRIISTGGAISFRIWAMLLSKYARKCMPPRTESGLIRFTSRIACRFEK